jgi:hypothetical protein
MEARQGETYSTSGSRRHLVFLNQTQTLSEYKRTLEDIAGAFPPAITEIHHASMTLRPQKTRPI